MNRFLAIRRRGYFCGRGAAHITQHKAIQPLDLFTRPRRFAQKFKAGVHAGIAGKAADGDALRQFCPPKMRHEGGQNGFEGQPVQGVVALRGGGSRDSRRSHGYFL